MFVFTDACLAANACTDEGHECEREGADYKCNCTTGYYLSEDQHQCYCREGYRNVSNDCIDIDECMEGVHDCGEGYSCNNTQGSYDCIDIDECRESLHDCGEGVSCNNTVGSYLCHCPPTYILQTVEEKQECVCGEGLTEDVDDKICKAKDQIVGW